MAYYLHHNALFLEPKLGKCVRRKLLIVSFLCFVSALCDADVVVEQQSVHFRTQIRVKAFAQESEIVSNPLRWPVVSEVVDDGSWVEAGQAVMDQDEFAIRVKLGRGEADATVLTCDLSYDYVRINAEYRT